jgi:hypothetical protein
MAHWQFGALESRGRQWRRAKWGSGKNGGSILVSDIPAGPVAQV